jgi:hypothetical protein
MTHWRPIYTAQGFSEAPEFNQAEVVCDNSMHAGVLRPFFFNSKNYAYLYEYIYINRVFKSNQELKIGWTVSNQLRHLGLV